MTMDKTLFKLRTLQKFGIKLAILSVSFLTPYGHCIGIIRLKSNT